MTTVLIAEDDVDLCALVAFKLTRAGFEVVAESDGQGALMTALSVRPDVAVIDFSMPKLSGSELCRELRDNPATAAVGVLLLTASARAADIEEAFAAGADDYMPKPFSGPELVRRVRALSEVAEQRSGAGR